MSSAEMQDPPASYHTAAPLYHLAKFLPNDCLDVHLTAPIVRPCVGARTICQRPAAAKTSCKYYLVRCELKSNLGTQSSTNYIPGAITKHVPCIHFKFKDHLAHCNAMPPRYCTSERAGAGHATHPTLLQGCCLALEEWKHCWHHR